MTAAREVGGFTSSDMSVVVYAWAHDVSITVVSEHLSKPWAHLSLDLTAEQAAELAQALILACLRIEAEGGAA